MEGIATPAVDVAAGVGVDVVVDVVVVGGIASVDATTLVVVDDVNRGEENVNGAGVDGEHVLGTHVQLTTGIVVEQSC